MRTIYASTTRSTKPEDTLLGQSFIKQAEYFGRSDELHIATDNKESLAKMYNKLIIPEYRDCIIVFVHDDVTLNVSATTYELHQALQDNDIIGLAGCTKAKIARPALWHLMADRNMLSGAVAHPIRKGSEEVFMSSFGPYPQRCAMMDGLFLAAKVSTLLDRGVKFDESNPTIAHFYDLDFCLTAQAVGLKMSTWPIYVTHRSPGLSSIDDPVWKAGQEWFIKKWGEVHV